ncbi:hypothetical protein IKG20_00505 [Candidatus Saccharibacteria bacterium]|nr:hypothetical protein [Candidatus Saccharibacteria bacterium]
MEFFAWIGIITVIWVLYDFIKYAFIDCRKEIEEEDEEIARILSENEEPNEDKQNRPEKTFKEIRETPRETLLKKPEPKGVFTCNLEDEEALKEPVFKSLPGSKSNEDIKELNLNLKHIGIYARLYYFLINLFEIPENHYRSQNGVKVRVFEAELIRREVEERIFKGKSKKKIEPLGNDDIEIIKFANSALRKIYATIQSSYSGLRSRCLKELEKEENREMRLEKINAILSAEKESFRSEPVWRDYFKQLTEPHLERIMSECNELGPH